MNNSHKGLKKKSLAFTMRPKITRILLRSSDMYSSDVITLCSRLSLRIKKINRSRMLNFYCTENLPDMCSSMFIVSKPE